MHTKVIRLSVVGGNTKHINLKDKQMSAFLELIKARAANVVSFLTSKRAYIAAGSIVVCKFIDNNFAIGCATVVGCVFIICDTVEKFVRKDN